MMEREMTLSDFGLVLETMADQAKYAADAHRDYMGANNSYLLSAIQHMLLKGADRCREIEESNSRQP